MQAKTINIGLLGAGYIMDSHARAIHSLPSANLYAVCDISEERARAAADRFRIPHVFTSLEALLDSPVDAIHVLLPPHLHEEAAERCIASGRHVLLEKPMGLESNRCARLVELAKSRGVKLGVSHNFLFNPVYENLRGAIKGGRLGKIDRVTVNWLFPLALIQHGPYDNWMLQSPGNLFFELAPHAVAFALDIIGPVDEVAAVISDPIDLPGRLRVYRQWTMIGSRGRSSCVINLSINPGQEDRSLHVRGSAAVGRLDYGRGIGWIERSATNNPIFESLSHGRSLGKTVIALSRANFRRYAGGSLFKIADSSPYGESIRRSIEKFYSSPGLDLDPRLYGAFGVEVIRACERVVEAAGTGKRTRTHPATTPVRASEVLVVGGTGFIGKRLVAILVGDGHSVRILSRSRKSALPEFDGLPVDIVQGSHGDSRILDSILPGIRTVYHLAKASGTTFEDYLKADIEPTQTLARACLRHGVERFIYTGTIDSYSSSNPSVTITASTPLDRRIKHRNPYSRSKAACEQLLLRMYRQEGLPLVIVRPGIVIGKGSPCAHWGVGKFLTDGLVQFWGNGDTMLPFVLVDDVARALVLAGVKEGIEGKTFLCTDRPMLTAREYVEAVERYSGMKIQCSRVPIWKHFAADFIKEIVKHAIRHPHRRSSSYHDWACRAHRSQYDPGATIVELGWQPCGDKTRMIEQGIKAAVEHYYR